MASGVLPARRRAVPGPTGRPPLAIGDTLPEGQVGFLRIRGKSCVASPSSPSVQITERQHVSAQSPSVILEAAAPPEPRGFGPEVGDDRDDHGVLAAGAAKTP